MTNPFTPSTVYPPITYNADPKAYVSLGSDIQRGKPEFVMSRGELMRFAVNPWKWLRAEKDDQTAAMAHGSALDCLSLTPARFAEQYAVCPDTYPSEGGTEKPWNWNANYCKDWRKTVEAEGREPIKPTDWDAARDAAARLMEDPLIARLFDCSQKQVQCMVEYRDKDTGLVVQIKTLIDLVPDKSSEWGRFLADLKSANDAEIRAWEKAVFAHKYAEQAAMYVDAFNAVTGENRDSFLHVVQESEAPYAVARRMLSDEFLTLGRDNYRRALKHYCRCIAEQKFPGYDDMNDNSANPIVDGWRVTQPAPWMIAA